MKETIIIGICTVAASIVGAFLANILNAKKEERNEQNFENSIIQSIESELKTLWKLFGVDFIENLESRKDTEIYTWIYTARYDYFNIYNANSLFIGKIKNPKLRSTIIETYVYAKSFLEDLVNYGEEYKKVKFEKEQLLKVVNSNLKFAISPNEFEHILDPNIPTNIALSNLKINVEEPFLLFVENSKKQIIDQKPLLIYRTNELKKTFLSLKEQFRTCLNLFEEELKPKIPKICWMGKQFCNAKQSSP